MSAYLLEITSKWTEISDLITSKWLEILGWISIPAIGTAIVVGIIKLIITCIQKKINKKNIKPIVDEVKKAREEFNSQLKAIREETSKQIDDYKNAVEKGIKKGLSSYENAKATAYNKIIAVNDDVKKLVGEVKPIVIDVQAKTEEVIEEKKTELAGVIDNAKDKVEEVKEIAKDKIAEVVENVSHETSSLKKKIDEVDNGVFER